MHKERAPRPARRHERSELLAELATLLGCPVEQVRAERRRVGERAMLAVVRAPGDAPQVDRVVAADPSARGGVVKVLDGEGCRLAARGRCH